MDVTFCEHELYFSLKTPLQEKSNAEEEQSLGDCLGPLDQVDNHIHGNSEVRRIEHGATERSNQLPADSVFGENVNQWPTPEPAEINTFSPSTTPSTPMLPEDDPEVTDNPLFEFHDNSERNPEI